jgi:hypothetical protein
MSYRKLFALLLLAGLVSTRAACSDVTAPQGEFCAVTGGGSTCPD